MVAGGIGCVDGQKPCSSAVPSLESEIRKVTVAGGNVGSRHQQPIDHRHQAAEECGRGREAERGSLGHLFPLLRTADRYCSSLGIPDARNNGVVSIAACPALQCNIKRFVNREPSPLPTHSPPKNRL